MIIPAFKVQGTGIQSVVNVCQMPRMHVSVSLQSSGELAIQIFNANAEAKLISQKMMLVGVMIYPQTEVEWDKSYEKELPVSVFGVTMGDWEMKFLGLMEKSGQYGQSEFLRKLTVCYKEID